MHETQEQGNNNRHKGLIITITVLSVILVIGIISVTLVLTGIITFKTIEPVPDAVTAAQTEAYPVATPDAAPTAVPQDNTTKKTMYVVNVENSIYLRSDPSENDKNIITTVPLGSAVGYIESIDSVFARINYGGTIGYAKLQYLSDTQPVIDNTVKYTMYVANVENSIYLRSAPSENDNNIITTIALGTAVGYISSANSIFAKISYNGTVGYAKHQYLSSNYYGSAKAYDNTMYVTNVQDSIYLRSAPAENSSNIITTIPLGTAVTFIENIDGTFYKINYNGTVGYAKAEYLEW